MKRLTAYCLLLIAFFLSGCVMRVAPRKVDRVDQELKGNRGIIMGRPIEYVEPETKKTKTVYDVEVELGSHLDVEKDVHRGGNRGYIKRTKSPVKEVKPIKTPEPVTEPQRLTLPEMPKVIYQKPLEPEKQYAEEKGGAPVQKKEKEKKVYVVEKGDTLQKISKKMYGTTKRWKVIFEANKNVLKSPDMIKPGQKLVIPLD